jgi:NitT/TauT family transport system ATP-binding protein
MGAVSLVDASKSFRIRIDSEVHTINALQHVGFTIRSGDFAVLIGPSGCAKTSALRIAMGLDSASAGSVLVDGREVRGCGYDRGMVFQHAELLPWLTAPQNVMFRLEMKGVQGQQLRDTARSGRRDRASARQDARGAERRFVGNPDRPQAVSAGGSRVHRLSHRA